MKSSTSQTRYEGAKLAGALRQAIFKISKDFKKPAQRKKNGKPCPGIDADTIKLVLISIACHLNVETGEAFPGISTIADESNRSEPTVKRTIKYLEALGLLSKRSEYYQDENGQTKRGSNRYTLDVESIRKCHEGGVYVSQSQTVSIIEGDCKCHTDDPLTVSQEHIVKNSKLKNTIDKKLGVDLPRSTTSSNQPRFDYSRRGDSEYVMDFIDSRYRGDARCFFKRYVSSEYVKGEETKAVSAYNTAAERLNEYGNFNEILLAMVLYTVSWWSEEQGDIIDFFSDCGLVAWSDYEEVVNQRKPQQEAA